MRLFALLAAILFAGPAIACEKFVSIDPIQQKSDFAILADDSADPIDRITAFTTLVCADQIAVRRKALQDGLKASPEIRSESLFRSLAGNTAVNIRLKEVTGLTDAHYDHLASQPLIAHSIKFSDPSTSCISLYYNDRCAGSYAINVRGDQLDYNHNDNAGSFRLEDGKLSGEVTLEINRQHLTFPAEIILF